MSDRRELARRLVLQKSILDRLRDADAEDRSEARVEYQAGDADSVVVDGVEFGRVRRDRGRRSFKIMDYAAFDRWVRENVPSQWVAIEQVHPSFRAAILKTGEYITEDGEVLYPDGVEAFMSEGYLVVSPTDAASEWAARAVGSQLQALPVVGESDPDGWPEVAEVPR